MARDQAVVARTRGEGQDEDLVRLYLDSIGKYPLLTKEDEFRLSRLVQEGAEAKEELARKGNAVSPARRRQLVRVARRGDAATEEFINCNLRLVVSIAKRYQSSELPLLDLVQEGNLGLIHAVGKFDWRKGFKFSTYATWWIKQAISRGIDNTARTVRLPVHAGDQVRRLLRVKRQIESQTGASPTYAQLARALDITEAQVVELLQHGSDPVSLESHVGPDGESELGDIVPDLSSPSPFDVVAAGMLRGEVNKLLSTLDEREQQILKLRFGFDRGDPRTLEEVGAALHLTRERIRQIERAALSKLRHPSAKSDSRDLLAS
jgi:RNA polymerase sigma factor (sigma-70 family)